MSPARRASRVVLQGYFVFLHVLSLLAVGPALEAALAPPIRDVRITPWHRDALSVCWRLESAMRDPASLRATYWAAASASDPARRIGLHAYPPTARAPGRSVPAGALDLCADIPDPLKSAGALLLTGGASFDSAHRLWRIDAPLPGFSVSAPWETFYITPAWRLPRSSF